MLYQTRTKFIKSQAKVYFTGPGTRHFSYEETHARKKERKKESARARERERETDRETGGGWGWG